MKTFKCFVQLSFAAFLISASSSAFAQTAPAGTLIAPAPTANSSEKSAVPASSSDPDSATGFALKVEIPVVVPSGQVGGSVSEMGPGVGIGGAAGYYVTPHIGLFAGAQVSFGHSWTACGSTCKGVTFEAPVYIELAQNRAHGFYGTAGLALFATQSASDSTGASLAVTSPFDLKLGLGYRVSQRDFSTQNGPSRVAFSVFVNGTVGEFQSISTDDGQGNTQSSDIPQKDLHYTIQAGIGGSFFL